MKLSSLDGIEAIVALEHLATYDGKYHQITIYQYDDGIWACKTDTILIQGETMMGAIMKLHERMTVLKDLDKW